jgi:glyoxylase-like metal-dependent hydrolase (beta-lactamase superfamily II)
MLISKLNKAEKGKGQPPFHEVAPGVYFMEVGKGIDRSNVFFVRSGSSWVLIDAASVNCGRLIRKAADSIFGVNIPPALILLTHCHPDHAGSVHELVRMWSCPVYVHPDELPVAIAADIPTFEKYANPLDRWIVLPLLRIMPRRRVATMFSVTSLKDVVQAFDPGVPVPGLPDWECVPAPGHTPGQVAFFRPGDRVMITGDAVVTVDINSFGGFLLWSLRINKQRISGPPWYSTLNKQLAKKSVAAIAALEPRVLASGHGVPMQGERTAQELHAFANRYLVSGGKPDKNAK